MNGWLRFLLGGFFLAHGLIHVAYGTPTPPPGPVPWPFDLKQSRLLNRMGLTESVQRGIGRVLWVMALLTFAAAGLGVLGVPLLAAAWQGLALMGAAASLLILTLFWNKMLVVGVLIDIGLCVALLI